MQAIPAYWSLSIEELLGGLDSTPSGLSSAEAAHRLQLGSDRFQFGLRLSRTRVLWRQLNSPLLLLLVFAAIMSQAGERRRRTAPDVDTVQAR